MSPPPLTSNTAIGASSPAPSDRRRPTTPRVALRREERPFVSGGVDLRSRRSRRGARGAVAVELLIAYIPVLFCFLAFWQLGELLVAQMVVARASSAAGRAAVVVLPDDPMFYGNEPKGTLGGKRQGDVRLAAGMILAASPHLAEDFELTLLGVPQDVGVMEVSVAANFRCNRLRFVCGTDGVVSLKATSAHAYHGARYEYEPTDLSSAASGDLFASGDASCRDGDPSSNGGRGGRGNDGTGGRGNDGTGGRGNDGTGGRGHGGTGGRGGADGNGGSGSTRNGNDLCGPGSTQRSDGSCTPKNCNNINDSRKRKQCEDDCPNTNDVRDEVGECCASLKRVKLENGQSAQRCQEPKLSCVNQVSATKSNGHHLTGTITADDTTLQLPKDIAPDFAEICRDATTCTASTGGSTPEDIGVSIVANLKLKQMESWCKEGADGSRKAETEQIKTEWNDWAKSYRTVWLNSPEGKAAIANHPLATKDPKKARSAAWSTKKSALDRQRDAKAAAGTRPQAGEGGVSSYRGPNPRIAPFFKALDAWCDALEGASKTKPIPYEKFLTPEVKAAEAEMLKNLKAMPKPMQTSIDSSLKGQTGSNHTEAKVIELLEGWAQKYDKNLQSMDLNMKLTGDWSPCNTCTERLKDFVKSYGGTVEYCWTKGIYSTGIGRDDSLVQGNGSLMSGVIKHQGCVTISPTGTKVTGEKLCPAGEKNGKPSKSTAN